MAAQTEAATPVVEDALGLAARFNSKRRLVNLTGEDIRFKWRDGTVHVLRSQGDGVDVNELMTFSASDDCDLIMRTYRRLPRDFPAPREDTFLVVTKETALAAPHRTDLLVLPEVNYEHGLPYYTMLLGNTACEQRVTPAAPPQ